MQKPFFTISLDFELFWGVRDLSYAHLYRPNILGGRDAIPHILSLFKQYKIHATWATVAMITFETKKDLLQYLPEIRPKYRNYQPYKGLDHIGENERDDPYHFGYSLLRKISDTPGMEIASHSFSHFYCLENTVKDAFKSDLEEYRFEKKITTYI